LESGEAEIEIRIATLRAKKNGEGQPLTRLNAIALAGRWCTSFVGQHEKDPGPAKRWQEMSDHLVWNVNAGYLYLEVRCLGCDTNQSVALDVVRRSKVTPIHELERYMRCKDCSQVRGYAYKRSHLVALRQRKISASDPISTWWPGEQ
jgi:hypothetical protein